jgi:hypothetical protein
MSHQFPLLISDICFLNMVAIGFFRPLVELPNPRKALFHAPFQPVVSELARKAMLQPTMDVANPPKAARDFRNNVA